MYFRRFWLINLDFHEVETKLLTVELKDFWLDRTSDVVCFYIIFFFKLFPTFDLNFGKYE